MNVAGDSSLCREPWFLNGVKLLGKPSGVVKLVGRAVASLAGIGVESRACNVIRYKKRIKKSDDGMYEWVPEFLEC